MVYKYILVVYGRKGIYFSDEIGEDDEFAYFIVENYERTFRKVK